VDLSSKLRKCLLAVLHYAANGIQADNGSSRAVHHTLRMKKILDEFHVALVKHLMKVAPHYLPLNRFLMAQLDIRRHLDSIKRRSSVNRLR
jgi:hypothetical protein